MVKAIPMEDWLRGCIYHDGRHGYVTLPTDKVHQIANYIQRTRRSGMDGLIDLEVVEADRKTENSSEKPNNCEGEPQYDFGEYADRLWKIAYERGKREALEQTEPSCDTCKLKDTTEWCKRQEVCRAYQPET